MITTIIVQDLASQPIKQASLTPTRDMNYLTNTVDAFVKAAESDAAIVQVIHTGSGREIFIGDLAKLIYLIIGVVPRLDYDAQRKRCIGSEVNRLSTHNTRTCTLLGCQLRVSLEDGLLQAIV
jgi:nucleoside-diphosphate-sugar epimerase